MSQTSYNITQGLPFAGILGEEGYPSMIRNGRNAGSVNISPGCFVTNNAAGDFDNLKAFAVAADVVAGIAVHRHSVNPIGAAFANGEGIPVGDRFDVLVKGTVWMIAEGTIATTNAYTALFVRAVANGAGKLNLGALTATSDTTFTRAAPKGMRILQGCTGAGVVLVEFDLLIALAA
jgi:hypothetical protein